MKSSNSSSSFVVAIAKATLRYRWLVILASLALTAVALVGTKNIIFDGSYRIFFSEDNPQLKATDALHNTYTKDDNVLYILTAKEGGIYQPRFLEATQWLTDEAWQIPFSQRVDSVTNFQNSSAVDDFIEVSNLVEGAPSRDPAALREIREIAEAEPLLMNRILNAKGLVAGVNVTLTLPEKDIQEGPIATAKAREIEKEFNKRFPEIETHLAGIVLMNNAFAESTMNDMKNIVTPMFLAIFVLVGIFLRSVWGSVATALVIGLTVLTAFGAMGWMGINMSSPLGTMPIMIMTLAVADSIHILVTWLQEMRSGRTKHDALVESVRINFLPVFLTTLTTAIGFLSMNFSDTPPFRDLGNVVATGVVAAWLFSVFFLPALVSVLPVRVRRNAATDRGAFDRWVYFLAARRYPVLIGSALVVAFMGMMVPRLELNDQWTKYFDESQDIRQDMDYAEENLTGFTTFEFSLPAGEPGGINEPEYLKLVDRFAQWYKQHPDVLQVNSIADVIKRLNRNMHGDDPAYYRIPEERQMAAQYILMYNFNLPKGMDLTNQINVDESATRFIVTARDLRTRELRELFISGEQWLEQNAPEHMHVKAAGANVMFAFISERNIEGMIAGTLLALLVITLILLVALRSVKYGLISLIPNVVPAVLGIGAWSLLYGEMGMSLSVITGMTLGIVVDDSVHFLTKYIRARREKGLEGIEAVRYAFSTVGRALVVTTVILAVGFGILGLSSFRLNNWMGQLTAIVIVFALIADFVLLPVVLLLVDGKKKGKEKETPADRSGRVLAEV